MKLPTKNVALIVAAGKGERTGGEIPKQFNMLGGKTVIAHAVDAFTSHPAIDAVFVVVGEGQNQALVQALAGRPITGSVVGGSERQDSVRAGLNAIAAAGGADIVFIHDAARPFVPLHVIDHLFGALQSVEGAIPVIPVVDTLVRDDGTLGDVVDRSGLSRVQTPQAFRFDAIMTSHIQWSGKAATDDAQMARNAGFKVVTVTGDALLDKITHPADFALAESRMKSSMITRTGLGFDVHRLESGQKLWLCGIEVPHEKGLSGHSDADVALHALTDALLGAATRGDIGDHFPPSDPQWRGVASSRFVEHARDIILDAGGMIDHVDLTLMCEAPKIGPFRDRMRARIAELLRVSLNAVSVKATTTERLGFTGRGEGIASQAIVTVRMPKEV
ncbi:MAG: bifunctional 2-C-methyl-D-erythritol 4-phosphate cytidylyltransferase/2-C-methyl-D-erythritol 2,4-cyclodiphosphate synthase [Chakrabartia sp.]